MPFVFLFFFLFFESNVEIQIAVFQYLAVLEVIFMSPNYVLHSL